MSCRLLQSVNKADMSKFFYGNKTTTTNQSGISNSDKMCYFYPFI